MGDRLASCAGLLEAALTATRNGLQETRRALDALRARPLDDLGLQIALCDMVEAAAGMANLRLDLQLLEQLPVLPASTEQTIYRIVQEALGNVAKHAQVSQVEVALTNSTCELCLIISDRGVGIGEIQKKGLGLVSVRERARQMGGVMTIQNLSPTGTKLIITIERPLSIGVSTVESSLQS